MILIEMNTDQRAFILDMASVYLSLAARQAMAHRLTSDAVAYQGAYMCEVTSNERAWMTECAERKMNALAYRDSNAWLTYEYAQMERLTYALYVGCAE